MAAAEIRILFVDDSPEDVELEVRSLRRAGLKVRPLRVDTEAALAEALQAFGPDLVVSDFRLPALDGLAALQAARARRADLPFLFVTASLEKKSQFGRNPYVSKDRLEELPDAVRRALGNPPA